MTPHQFAKTECANFDTDGTCLMIEPSSWHNYSLPLPGWMTGKQWQSLVDEARAKNTLMVEADRTTCKWLDMSKPHANRRRLDMYYCPSCRQRMGNIGALCLGCKGGKFQPDDVDRRCRVSVGKQCRYFERCILPIAEWPAPSSLPKRERCQLLAGRLEARQAYLNLHGLRGATNVRMCPQCNEQPLAKCKRLCDECAEKNLKDSQRRKRKKRRDQENDDAPEHS